MDDEDLADAEEAKRIQTSDSYAALGSFPGDAARSLSGLAGLFRPAGETIGVKLLQRMGWKQGQGIGPKIRRKAQLSLKSASEAPETFLFAPEDVSIIKFVRKSNHKGLGYGADVPLPQHPISVTRADKESESDDPQDLFSRSKLTTGKNKKKSKPVRGGIGIGILNDTGSDDEDPFELGPKISYSRIIGGEKKKKKGLGSGASPSIPSQTIFAARKKGAKKSLRGFRMCRDGRLPVSGFVLELEPDKFMTEIMSERKYPPPIIPEGWQSSKMPEEPTEGAAPGYKRTTEVVKESKLDPVARAEILGESQLPGKSVFDFLSNSARDRLAAATGKSNLPPGKGEIPAEYAISEGERLHHLFSQVPTLDRETALAAIHRDVGPGAPYGDDQGKRNRYRRFLEYHAGYYPEIPERPADMKDGVWLNELEEFYSCARIFKPITGAMASRFTTSASSKEAIGLRPPGTKQGLIIQPAVKPKDPAEEAARMGMFGPMTRTVENFFPSRLLYKRFGIKPPANVQEDTDEEHPQARSGAETSGYHGQPESSFGAFAVASGEGPAQLVAAEAVGRDSDNNTQGLPVGVEKQKPVILDAGRNNAIEGKRALDDVFKAVFGDSDEEDEQL